MSPSTSTPKPPKESSWRAFLVWALLALLLRWQVIEPRWIPSGSMLPTLEIQDRILVEKLRPRITRKEGRQLSTQSVVVFHPPKTLVEAGYEANSALIKRIVGLPGDQIAVHNGYLYRNGKLIEESWLQSPMKYEMDSVIVPKDSLWVLGDNRNNSLDSHLWGALPIENVIGTAIWRYWPLEKFGPIRFPTPINFET